MSEPGLVSLVLPCRNQADHIGELLPRYLEALATFRVPFELVVVPNASADATALVVTEFASREPRIRVVENPEGGWGRSVRAGLDAARGEVLAYTNTARTDPAVLPTFLRRYHDRGPCVVKARREARRPVRSLGSTLYNLEARACFGLRCFDVNGTPQGLFERFLPHRRAGRDRRPARPGADGSGPPARCANRGGPRAGIPAARRPVVHHTHEPLGDVRGCSSALARGDGISP